MGLPRSLLLLAAASASLVSETFANDPFLKEILMGRCYERWSGPSPVVPPPTTCGEVVGSFLNLLESRTESGLTERAFAEAYTSKADFSSPRDAGLVRVALGGGSQDENGTEERTEERTTSPFGLLEGGPWVTPETTPGGSLLDGLVFCANGNQENCTRESSGAYWKFWASAYASFARSAEGRLSILLEDERVDGAFLERAFLSHLGASGVEAVGIWGVDCASPLAGKVSSFVAETVGLPCSCGGPDVVELALCGSTSTSGAAAEACAAYRRGKEAANANDTDNANEDADANEDAGGAPGEPDSGTEPPSDGGAIAEEDHERKHGGWFFPWFFLAIGGYLWHKKKHPLSPCEPGRLHRWCEDRTYDCIKGDLFLPSPSFRTQGSRDEPPTSSSSGSGITDSSSSMKYSSFANSYHGSGASGSAGGVASSQ